MFNGQANPSLLTSPSQVPLYNRAKTLDIEEQSMDDQRCSQGQKALLPISQPPPQGRKGRL